MVVYVNRNVSASTHSATVLHIGAVSRTLAPVKPPILADYKAV